MEFDSDAASIKAIAGFPDLTIHLSDLRQALSNFLTGKLRARRVTSKGRLKFVILRLTEPDMDMLTFFPEEAGKQRLTAASQPRKSPPAGPPPSATVEPKPGASTPVAMTANNEMDDDDDDDEENAVVAYSAEGAGKTRHVIVGGVEGLMCGFDASPLLRKARLDPSYHAVTFRVASNEVYSFVFDTFDELFRVSQTLSFLCAKNPKVSLWTHIIFKLWCECELDAREAARTGRRSDSSDGSRAQDHRSVLLSQSVIQTTFARLVLELRPDVLRSAISNLAGYTSFSRDTLCVSDAIFPQLLMHLFVHKHLVPLFESLVSSQEQLLVDQRTRLIGDIVRFRELAAYEEASAISAGTTAEDVQYGERRAHALALLYQRKYNLTLQLATMRSHPAVKGWFGEDVFRRFLKQVQLERDDAVSRLPGPILSTFSFLNNRTLSAMDFCSYLTSPDANNAIRPLYTTTCQDMGQPLHHYFISASTCPVSLHDLQETLRLGCRFLELEIGARGDGQPVVDVATQPPLVSWLDVIAQDGFAQSEYPMILSFVFSPPTAASSDRGLKLAVVDAIRRSFGAMLYTRQQFDEDRVMPKFCPALLKRRVLISYKHDTKQAAFHYQVVHRQDTNAEHKSSPTTTAELPVSPSFHLDDASTTTCSEAPESLGHSAAFSDSREAVDEEHLDPGFVPPSKKGGGARASPAPPKIKTGDALADIAVLGIRLPNTFDFLDASWIIPLTLRRINVIEKGTASEGGPPQLQPGLSSAFQLRAPPPSPQGGEESGYSMRHVTAHAMVRFVSRHEGVYHEGSTQSAGGSLLVGGDAHVRSSPGLTNPDFLSAWQKGCQVVPMNFATWDASMRLYDTWFAVNGRSGYLLKPSYYVRAPLLPPPEQQGAAQGVGARGETPSGTNVNLGTCLSVDSLSPSTETASDSLAKREAIIPAETRASEEFVLRITVVSVQQLPVVKFAAEQTAARGDAAAVSPGGRWRFVLLLSGENIDVSRNAPFSTHSRWVVAGAALPSLDFADSEDDKEQQKTTQRATSADDGPSNVAEFFIQAPEMAAVTFQLCFTPDRLSKAARGRLLRRGGDASGGQKKDDSVRGGARSGEGEGSDEDDDDEEDEQQPSSSVVAETTVPVLALRMGFRALELKDTVHGHVLPFTSLLCRFSLKVAKLAGAS